MYFIYNGITVGSNTSYSSNTAVINKPNFSGDRNTLNITIEFILRQSSESSFWSTYNSYLDTNTGLLSPGKKLEIFIVSGTTLTFDPAPSSGSPLGIPVESRLEIVGSPTDCKLSKTLRITFTINLTSVIANGAKNVNFSHDFSVIGQKHVTITAEFPKMLASGVQSATKSMKDNLKTLATAILLTFGGDSKFQLVDFRTNSNDPNMAQSGTEINYVSVTARYTQVFFNQEVGKLVSTVLKDVNLNIIPEKYIDFKPIESENASASDNALIRTRLRAEYTCQVLITSSRNGGQDQDFDISITNSVSSDKFLADIFYAVCFPRIEEVIRNQGRGELKLFDVDVRYNVSNCMITATLVFDTLTNNILYYDETIEIDQTVGYPYKLQNLKNDEHYVDRPGRTTIITVADTIEYFKPLGTLSMYKPGSCDLLKINTKTMKGTPHCRSIKEGFPVYETSSIGTITKVYIKNVYRPKDTSGQIVDFENDIIDGNIGDFNII